jgi:hypothetical protein
MTQAAPMRAQSARHPNETMKKLTGVQITIESLIAEGVEVVFGRPIFQSLLDRLLSLAC